MANKKSSKELIIDSAFDLFHSKGFNATSMQEIAVEAGMTKAGLYHHFNSKEDLMIHVLRYELAALREKLFSMAYVTEGLPEDRLIKFYAMQEKLFLAKERSCFLGNMTLETCREHEKFAGILTVIFHEWQAALSHLIGNFKSAKISNELAEQSIVEFEGAIMIGLIRPTDDMIVKRAVARSIDRALN